jgi:hypothetical protein
VSIHDLLDARDEAGEERRTLRRVAAPLAALCVAAGAVALLLAASLLADADLGTAVRARACAASPLLGLSLFLVAGALLGLAPTLARLRHTGAVAIWDPRALLVALPVPLVLAAASVPGVLGCSLGAELADLSVVGSALGGTGGLLLAPAALVLAGAALTLALHVSWALVPLADAPDAPSIVEQAMLDAELLEQEPHGARFHGVDSTEQ